MKRRAATHGFMTNEIIIRGKFAGIGVNELGYHVLTVRLNGRIKRNVRLSLLKKVEKIFRPGDEVEIKGHVVAFDYDNFATKSHKHIQYLVMDEIKLTEPDLRKVFEEAETIMGHDFTCFIEGVVVGNDNGTLKVKTEGVGEDKRYKYVEILYADTFRKKMETVKTGQNVRVRADIFPEDSVHEGNIYCPLILRDIVVSEEKGEWREGI